MASDPFVQRHIRNLPLFARLTSPQVEAVARTAETLQFAPGQLAFQEGQPTRGLMLFVAGRGVLTRLNANGIEEPIGSVETGQYINESALYTTNRESANLRIVEDSVVILIPRGRFVQLLPHMPELRANLRVQTDSTHREAPNKLFKGQRDDETVLNIYRRHWWAFGRWLWIALAISLFLFVAAVMAASTAPGLALGAAALGVVVPGMLVAYLYYEWQDDSVIITDQRVVRIWNTLFTFENTLNEIPLDRIIVINAEIPPGDPFARLFNYGTVAVKTSGESANLTLDFTPNPMQVQQMIFAQRDQHRQMSDQRRKEMIRADIEQALGRRPPGMQTGESDANQPANAQDTSTGPRFLRTKFVSLNGDLVYRKHVSVWLAHIFLPMLMILAAIALFFLSFLPDFPVSGIMGIALSAVVALVGGVAFYLGDWDWRNDTFVVSKDAITIIRKRPLFLQSKVDSIRLQQVDNVRSEVTGVLNTLLNRGHVHISLIGAEANAKVFDRVYDPQSIQAEVSQRLSSMRSAAANANSDEQRQQLVDYLQVFQQIVDQQGQAGALTQSMQSQLPQQPRQPQQPRPYAPAAPPDEPTLPNPSANQAPPFRDGNRPPRIPRTRGG